MSPTKSSTSSSNTPLSERSPNTSSPSKVNSTSEKLMDGPMNDVKMPRFDHAVQKYTAHAPAPANGQGQCQQTQTYISPSDAMQSPTTKKLSEIKGRRFMNAKPQTLFAKTLNQESLRAQSRN